MSNNGVSGDKDKVKLISQTLIEMGIIPFDFTGSLTFHFRQGGLNEIERYEKCLQRLLKSGNSLQRSSR